MPYVELPGGIVAHIKVARPRRHLCSAIGLHGMQCSRTGTLQCDFAVGKRRTCSAYICRGHATEAGPDIHHCPAHANRQTGLFTALAQSKD